MLSNKMTFSLTSLVMLLAIVFVVSSATAAVDTEPEPELSVTDVSAANGKQLAIFPVGAPLTLTAVGSQRLIDAALVPGSVSQSIEFFIRLKQGVATLSTDNSTGAALGANAATADVEDEELHISDLEISFLDKNGITIPDTDDALPLSDEDTVITHLNPTFPDGRNFMVTIATGDIPVTARYMLVKVPAGAFKHADPVDVRAALLTDDKKPKDNKESSEHPTRFELVNADAGDPQVVSIVRVVPAASLAGSRFISAAVTGAFDVRITFSEEPKDFDLTNIADRLSIDNGIATAVYKGTPFYLAPAKDEGNYITPNGNDGVAPAKTADNDPVPRPTGRDALYHPYLVTIEPNVEGATFVEVRINKFEDLVLPPKKYTPPTNLASASGRSLLRVAVAAGAAKAVFGDLDPDPTKTVKSETKQPNEVFLPEEIIIPKEGYLILAVGKAEQHGIQPSPDKVADRKGPQLKYGIKNEFGLPYPGTDLEAFFRAGGTIELYHRDIAGNTTAKNADAKYQAAAKTYDSGAVVISEIMWGRDVSLGSTDAGNSQWIELYNTTGEAIGIDKHEWLLAFIQGNGTGTTETYGMTLIDEVGNVAPRFWGAPGSDGATKSSLETEVKGGVGVNTDGTVVEGKVGSVVETFALKTLTSMYRKIEGSTVMPGKSEASWAASTRDGSRNFTGLRAGTPGAATPYETPPPPTKPEPTPPTPVPPAKATDLMITEIMVPSNGGILPQWIEIKNVSGSEVSLNGWEVNIVNDASDTDVITTSLNITLGEVVLDKNQVALVVTKTGRNSGTDVAGVARTKGDANAGMFDADRIVNASVQLKPATRNYSILSESAFAISLVPPSPITSGADSVGNLVGGWELPMSDAKGERSSIIRREMSGATDILGTDAAGWVLASDTSLLGAYVETYYGDKDDMGTPGYDAIGALPVELSKFTAARDRVTGQVVITWETQSELNNAGFFIKRNEHRTGQFKVVNPTMIPGAGTTSEKQSYTYTDTTAKPNIVYYYQIEDVSLDGNRQTLTRSHRLKGHIGAAGKLSTLWGELKEQE